MCKCQPSVPNGCGCAKPVEFSIDWPHGHKYRSYNKDVVLVGKNPIREGGLVFVEAPGGACITRNADGRSITGIGTSGYDIINKPAPKEKVTVYFVVKPPAVGLLSRSVSDTRRCQLEYSGLPIHEVTVEV